MAPLTIRKLADRSQGTRVVRFDPVTGARRLVNPDTPGDAHEPWPLAGVQVVGEPPRTTRVPTSWVSRGIAEGWLVGHGARPVNRPAGPTQNAWASSHTGAPHTFIHYDTLTVKTVDGDVRYRVARQPDKYAADGDDTTPVTAQAYAAGRTRVDHFYDLELED